MEPERIRTAVEEAVIASLKSIKIQGIMDASVRCLRLSIDKLQTLGAQLALEGKCEIRLLAEIELLLRVSKDDLLLSVEPAEFCIKAISLGADLQTVATTIRTGYWPGRAA